MNDNFDNQKEILLSLRQEISLLRQQVDYLLRNGKALGLLDLDVLMNRTHTVYDMLCSINLGENAEEQDIDIDPDALSGLFGGLMMNGQQNEGQDEVQETVNEKGNPENEPAEETIEDEIPEESPAEEDQVEEENGIEEQPIAEEEHLEETIQEEPSAAVEFVIETPAEEEKQSPETFNPMNYSMQRTEEPAMTDDQPLGDEYGFFFRFDEVTEESAEQHEEQPAQAEKIVHFVEEVPEEEISERDLVDGEHLVHDNPFVMPVVEDGEDAENHIEETHFEMPKEEEPIIEPVDEPKEESVPTFQEEELVEEPESEPVPAYQETEPEEQEKPAPFVNDFGKDDAEYELDTAETLGEYMQNDDNSLAAKLQQKSVNELRTAIGINDKFLFVNELFGGSMEKYNRSIENLDDMKTLSGTLIYLNELKVELQWNNSNVAYQKLLDLVHRKFND